MYHFLIYTGAAWLSAVRVLRRSIKFGNERNPFYIYLLLAKALFIILPVKNWRKERITSSPHGLYELGYTRITLNITARGKDVQSEQIFKNVL